MTETYFFDTYAIIEIIKEYQLKLREELLAPFLTTSTGDLLFSIVDSIRGTVDRDLMDTILEI